MIKEIFQKKHNARLILIQSLYAHHFNDIANIQDLQGEVIAANKSIYEIQNFETDSELSTDLLNQIIKEQIFLDEIIKRYLASDWSLNRIDIVILSILRAATGEILYCPNVPEKVIIKEYIMLAEEFVGQEEIKFINAILDKIIHNKSKILPDS